MNLLAQRRYRQAVLTFTVANGRQPDSQWRAVLRLLTHFDAVWQIAERTINYHDQIIDIEDLDKTKGTLSRGEGLMIEAAISLYNGEGVLADVASTLDDGAFDTLMEVLRDYHETR